MKKKIRLTESGLRRMIKKYLNEALSYEELKDKYNYVLFDEPLEHYAVVYLYPGYGATFVTFAVEAHDDETAFEKVVAYCQNNRLTKYLVSQQEADRMVTEYLEDEGMSTTEYYEEHGSFDELYEESSLIYIDPTMEGGQEPCFIWNQSGVDFV